MSALLFGGIVLGYCLGKRALERRLINGVTGVVALLVILCFAFTTMVGWCQFLRYSENGSMLFSSWYLLLFSAWLGLFAASVLQAWREMRTPVSQMTFTGLSDKYMIVYDDPHNEGRPLPTAGSAADKTDGEGGRAPSIVTPFG